MNSICLKKKWFYFVNKYKKNPVGNSSNTSPLVVANCYNVSNVSSFFYFYLLHDYKTWFNRTWWIIERNICKAGISAAKPRTKPNWRFWGEIAPENPLLKYFLHCSDRLWPHLSPPRRGGGKRINKSFSLLTHWKHFPVPLYTPPSCLNLSACWLRGPPPSKWVYVLRSSVASSSSSSSCCWRWNHWMCSFKSQPAPSTSVAHWQPAWPFITSLLGKAAEGGRREADTIFHHQDLSGK